MADLSDILKQEMLWYGNKNGLNNRTFFLSDEAAQVYAVNVIDTPPKQNYPAGVVIMARIVEGQILIEADNTDRPLYQSLLEAGVPADKIVCVYAQIPA
jgi:hypothetical protein